MRERTFQFIASGTTLLFVAGICLAIAGGVLGSPILLGVGVGVAALITCGCICIREKNLAND